MSPRKGKQFSVWLPEELVEQVRVHCSLTGEAIRDFAATALEEKLEADHVVYEADLRSVLMFLQGRGVAIVEPEGAHLEVDLSQGLVILPQSAIAEGEWEPEEYLAQKVKLENNKIISCTSGKKKKSNGKVLFFIRPLD